MTRLYIPTTTAVTQTAGDNTTLIATDQFVTTAVNNAVAGVNPAVAVQWATTVAGDTSSLTYNNGVSGVGATMTGANNAVTTIDGHAFVVGDVGVTRVLIKNDTQSPSGAFNGVYLFTALHTVGTGDVFTRALDYNSPSEINNTGAIPVINGTVNGSTSWVETANITSVGVSPLAYTEFTLNPTTLMTTTVYDPANIAQQVVGTTATQTVSGKVLSDAFMGSGFISQSALAETMTLTASKDFIYPGLLEIGSTVSLEVPATSSLEVEAYVDQAAFGTQLGVAADATTSFANIKLVQSVTLPSVSDFLIDESLEVGVGTVMEIPPTSSLEIITYQPVLGLPANGYSNVSGTTTSSSFGDLTGAPVGPSVSVNIGVKGMAYVAIAADSAQNTAGDYCAITFAVSGNTTIAAATGQHESFFQAPSGGGNQRLSYSTVLTGLTSGVNTFTLKYRIAVGGTGTYVAREISVVPL